MSRDLQLIDVFAGCGGMTRGFSEAGFVPVAAVESDPVAAATYSANFGGHVAVREADEFARGSLPRADVVIGGPPCQGFSNLGRRDDSDPRNKLVTALIEVVRKARPAFFVVENVPPFLSSASFRLLEKACHPREVLAGYRLTAGILNAADFGTPQTRRRAIVLGQRYTNLELPTPTHGAAASVPWTTVREAWRHLPPMTNVTDDTCPTRPRTTATLHTHPRPSALNAARYAHIPVGGGRNDLPLHLRPDCWKRPTRGAADSMGRLSWDRPSVTIRTEFFKPEKGRYLHPEEPRGLTLAEGAVLQGFDEAALWYGTRAQVARQIGNAVPVQLASAIALQLNNALR